MPPFFINLRFAIAMFVCAIFAGCGDDKGGPVEAADRFFALCANGKAAEAFTTASGTFQIERSSKYFQARVRETGLDSFQEVKWTALDTPGRARVVRGDFKLKDGRVLPLNVSMVQDAGRWCLFGAKLEAGSEDIFAFIERSADGEDEGKKGFGDPYDRALPSDKELQKMVEKVLLDFDDAVKRNDFSDLYASASDRWKFRGKDARILTYTGKDPKLLEKADPENKARRLTVAALDHAFHAFVEANADISRIKGEKMILDEPVNLNTDRVLTVKGRYDTFVFQGGAAPKPCKLSFALEFVREGSAWKTFGITVNFAAPTAK